MGAITILLVMELTHRATGWGLITVCMLALLYAFAGPYLPGFSAHRGYGVTRLIEHLYLVDRGRVGHPTRSVGRLRVSVCPFWSRSRHSGGGALLIAMANRIAGRTRGGPAETAAWPMPSWGHFPGARSLTSDNGNVHYSVDETCGFARFRWCD